MLTSSRFWVGFVVGVIVYYAYMRAQARKSG